MLRGIVLAAATSLCCLDAFASSPRLDLLYHTTKGKDPVYESRGFLPIYTNDSSMLFSDVRTISNFKNIAEVNLGLGLRQKLSSINTIIGAYYFYDQRSEGAVYRQNTLGLELLAKHFEARGNIYRPFGENKAINNLSVKYDKASSKYNIDKQWISPLKGFDAEVGFVMPMQHFSFGVYGGLYNFSKENEDSAISGKKIRGELNANSIFPYNVSAALGVEYDYNDKPNDRFVRMSFKLGVPLSKNNQDVQFEDARMTKSVVRDLDIRLVEEHGVFETTTVAKTGKNNITFDKVIYVANEKEFWDVVNTTVDNPADKIAVVLSDDITILKPLKLSNNYYLISKPTLFEFSSTQDKDVKFEKTISDNKMLMYGDSFKLEDANGTMVDLDEDDDSDDQIVASNISQISKYLYDGTEYTGVKVVKDEDGFRDALKLSGNHIIILDDDVTFSKADKISMNDDKVVIGKGEITVKDSDNNTKTRKFSEERKLTEEDTNNSKIWSYGSLNGQLIIDGVALTLNAPIVPPRGNSQFGLTIKRSKLYPSKNYANSYMIDLDHVPSTTPRMLEDVTIDGNGLKAIFFDDGAAVPVFKNVSIDVKDKTKDRVTNIFNVNNARIEGKLNLSHSDNLKWTTDSQTGSLKFKEGAIVTISQKDQPTKVYEFTGDVTTTTLQNEKVTFNLATLGDNVRDISKNAS